MSAVLEVEDLHAGYGQVPVLNGISLTVGSGEPVGLLGPNGHGKTTLMRTVSGLQRPVSGDIRFNGESIVGASPRSIVDKGLVHVPQGSRLFPECTVHENLRTGLGGRGQRRRREQRLDLVYDLFPKLAERRGQLCGTLSGGERQMVAIGVGLILDPVLLLLDEPTLGLAPKVRLEVQDRIESIGELGTALLISDGDLELVSALTQRRYLVELGRIVDERHVTDAVGENELVGLFFKGSDSNG